MTDDPDNDDRGDMFSAMDELQIRSRRRINQALPMDPVSEFDDVPPPEPPVEGSLMADLDLPLPEPGVEAEEPAPLDFEIDLGDVEDEL